MAHSLYCRIALEMICFKSSSARQPRGTDSKLACPEDPHVVKYILSILAVLKDHSSRATALRMESNVSLCAEGTSRSLKIRLASYMTT